MAYFERPMLDGETTLQQRLQLLRDRYYILVGPLVLLLGIGLGNSSVLAWTSGILLILLTLNVFLTRLR